MWGRLALIPAIALVITACGGAAQPAPQPTVAASAAAATAAAAAAPKVKLIVGWTPPPTCTPASDR